MGFDLPALKKVYPDFHYSGKIRDTLLISQLIWTNLYETDLIRFEKGLVKFPNKSFFGKHSLEAWGYRLGIYKNEYGKTSDWSTWTPEMQTYCEEDVILNEAFWDLIVSKEYSEEAIQLEHDFARIIREQEKRGFLFDTKKAVSLYGELQEKRNRIKEKMIQEFPPKIITMKTPEYWTLTHGEETSRHETKGEADSHRKEMKWKPKDCVIEQGPMQVKKIPFNPSSRDQIAAQLIEKYKWKPSSFTPSGKPEINETILMKLPYPEAEELAEYFLLEKRIGMVAEGSGAWLKCVNKKTNRIHGRVITNGAVTGRCTHRSPNIAQVPSVGSPYGKECRELFTVPEGYKLVGADASGLQLRCLAHYMYPWDEGAYVKEILEGDIHTVNQEAAGLPTRDTSKTFIYAYIFGGGDARLGSIIGRGAKVGKQLRKTFETKLPAMGKLKEWLTKEVKSKGYVLGLDGRQILIRSEHSSLNFLLQGAEAAIMKKALIIFNDTIGEELEGKVFPVANVHDEVQLEVKDEKGLPSQVGEALVEAMQLSGKHFNFRCPIDGEYKVGNNWSETH